jgi:hypothetical protein
MDSHGYGLFFCQLQRRECISTMEHLYLATTVPAPFFWRRWGRRHDMRLTSCGLSGA